MKYFLDDLREWHSNSCLTVGFDVFHWKLIWSYYDGPFGKELEAQLGPFSLWYYTEYA